jgi:2-methylisocitrate lyase-like PEP mutase family enzyme
VLLQGHQPLPAAIKALKEVYTHLYNGGATADLKDKIVPASELDKLVNAAAYKTWQRDYLGVKSKE